MLTGAREQQVLISLGLTKGGKRQGAAESVILIVEPVIKIVKQWKAIASDSPALAPSVSQWRKLFNMSPEALQSVNLGFGPILSGEEGPPSGSASIARLTVSSCKGGGRRRRVPAFI